MKKLKSRVEEDRSSYEEVVQKPKEEVGTFVVTGGAEFYEFKSLSAARRIAQQNNCQVWAAVREGTVLILTNPVD